MKKKIFLLLLLSMLQINLNSSSKIPFVIQSQDKIFIKLAQEIAESFPQFISILIYDFSLLNGEDKLKEQLQMDFYNILSSYQLKYNYNLLFEKDAVAQGLKLDPKLDLTFIYNKDELEMIAFGKLLNQEAVLLSTITIIDGQTKNVWNPKLKKWEKKNIALFQGNYFNSESGDSIYRFSYYFIVE